MKSRFESKPYALGVVIFFLMIIYLPPIVMMVTPAKAVSEIEKRPLAPFPVVNEWKSWQRFPTAMNAYIYDHFGFRDIFVAGRAIISIRLFRSAPISSMMIGKEGWFFWNGNYLPEDFRGIHPFAASDVVLLLQGIRCKVQWLAEHGAKYLLMIVPEKQTIYPEYLPDNLQRRKGKTRFEQVREVLAQGYPDINAWNFLDLTEALLAEKKRHLIYYRTDTHWNFRGGFVGYQALMEHLAQWFPDASPKPRSFFEESVTCGAKGGDLVQMVNLHGILREDTPVFKPHFVRAVRWEFDTIKSTVPAFAMGASDQRLRAVVFRDSYFNYILPFLSEHFNEVVYIWSAYDQNILESLMDRLHPDVVIEEIVERFLSREQINLRENWQVIQLMSSENFNRAAVPLFRITSATGLLPIHDVSVEEGESAIAVKASGIDPHFLLSCDLPRKAVNLYLKIDIVSPGPTDLQAFYRVSDHPNYDEKYAATAPLVSGRNTVYLTLPGTDYNGPIRLDPGKMPGTYQIESIEIRTDGIGPVDRP